MPSSSSATGQQRWPGPTTGYDPTPADVVAAQHARDLLAAPGGMVMVFHTFQLDLALAVAGDHQAVAKARKTFPCRIKIRPPRVEADRPSGARGWKRHGGSRLSRQQVGIYPSRVT